MSRRPHKFDTWESYFIPGTKVLRNLFTSDEHKFGQPDAALLRMLEETSVAVRMLELSKDPIQGCFDYHHMKAIHRYLFQDVYEWAGQERVAPPLGYRMTKNGYPYYPAGPSLTEAAEKQYARLAEKNCLQGLGRNEFVNELAEFWGEINVVHSFREGNTRSQFVFFEQLTDQAGFQLKLELLGPGGALRDDFFEARQHSQLWSFNDRLASVLDQCLERQPEGGGSRSRPAVRDLRKNRRPRRS